MDVFGNTENREVSWLAEMVDKDSSRDWVNLVDHELNTSESFRTMPTDSSNGAGNSYQDGRYPIADNSYTWDEEDAKSYFGSMGARLEVEFVSYRPWAPKIYLYTAHRRYNFDTLVELWDWWEQSARETLSHLKWMDELASHFELASDSERALMLAWIDSPLDSGWRPEDVDLTSHPPRFPTNELPLGWREQRAKMALDTEWNFSKNVSLKEKFIEVERGDLDRGVPKAPSQDTRIPHYL